MTTRAAAPIDTEHAEFICGGVGMSAASCRPGALPNMARVTGCRIAADRRTVTLLIAATAGAALLDDVRRTGAIAAVFTEPRSHRTVQLKGNDARIVPTELGDDALAQRYVQAFSANVAGFGFPDAFMPALLAYEPGDLVAVQFTIAQAFSQTPGPHAGEPLADER